MASGAFHVKVQLDVHAVRTYVNVMLQVSRFLFTQRGFIKGNMSRCLAVPQWQSGSANQYPRFLCGIPEAKSDFSAFVPRQIYLRQDLCSTFPGGAAKRFGGGIFIYGIDTVDNAS